eukprot:gene12189-biopygen5513
MRPTGLPSLSASQTIANAADEALRSLVGNGTAASGTVTSVTADGVTVAVAVVRPTNATRNGTTPSYAIALPDSGTTVSIALPSTPGGGAVAVVVTTVDVPGTRFDSPRTNQSTNSSATVTLPPPQLVSSVVTVQVSQVNTNGTLSSTTVPYFETSVSVTRANSTTGPAKATVLVHNCTVGAVETVSLYCADTAVRLNLTCSGRAAATVRRQCPVSQAVCSVVDLADNRIVSNSFCRTVDLGSSVVCQCGGSGVNGSAITSAGRVSVGVFQVYGAGSLTSSVALASALSASDVAARSVMMFASFGCVWGVGLLLLLLSWRQNVAEAATVRKVQGSLGSDEEGAHCPTHIERLFPVFVRVPGTDDRWWRPRWLVVFAAEHPYLRMLRVLWDRLGLHGADAGEATRRSLHRDDVAMFDVVHALTSLTLACGVLALLYDFQYPEDDGFCAAQTTQATCESRKMLLDPFESQCLWRPPTAGATVVAAVLQQIVSGRVVDAVSISPTATAAESVSCRFNGSNRSTIAFLLSFLIAAAFSRVVEAIGSAIGSAIGYIFDIVRSARSSSSVSIRCTTVSLLPKRLKSRHLHRLNRRCDQPN